MRRNCCPEGAKSWRALLAALLLSGAAACAAPAPVTFSTRGVPRGQPELPLTATLYRPAGAGPFPAVVMLHGCGGIQAHHHTWATLLRQWGYVALVVDSFGPRGFRQRCNPPPNTPGHKIDRMLDAAAAGAFLRRQPFVDPARIGVIGWSHGAGTVLRLMDAPLQPREPGARFAGAVAVYPYCDVGIPRTFTAPLLILIGSADDWTPAAQCSLLVRTLPTDSAPVELVVYPGAFHNFDSGKAPRTYLGHHLAPDPGATVDAHRRVHAFLERTLAHPAPESQAP